MIHLRTNADIVIQTLKQYRYKPDGVKVTDRCYYQLNQFMENECIDVFNLTIALKWCEEKVACSEKRAFFQALLRLADVYEHGRVLSSHLTIHGDLSDEFSENLDSFIVSMSSQEFLESSYERYREACSMFSDFAR